MSGTYCLCLRPRTMCCVLQVLTSACVLAQTDQRLRVLLIRSSHAFEPHHNPGRALRASKNRMTVTHTHHHPTHLFYNWPSQGGASVVVYYNCHCLFVFYHFLFDFSTWTLFRIAYFLPVRQSLFCFSGAGI